MKRICVYVICLLACCLALCAQAENWDAEMPEEYAALLTEYARGLQGDEEVRDAYESVWTGYQCCLNAGIDPLDADTYREGMAFFSGLVDEYERLVDAKLAADAAA